LLANYNADWIFDSSFLIVGGQVSHNLFLLLYPLLKAIYSNLGMSGFVLPSIYAFKPFFTLQPVQATRDKQLRQWCDLIMQYHQHHGLYTMTPATFPLFRNEAIDRQLSREGVEAVIAFMINDGVAEWSDGASRSSLLIMWRRPDAIAAEVYEWATQRALINSIMTFYELHEGEEQRGASFYNIESVLLRKALMSLQASGKCQIMRGETADEDGIKFL